MSDQSRWSLGRVVSIMRQCWPTLSARSAVLSGYRALGAQHKHVLADIALRNHVFAPLPVGDALTIARAEGRRECALEIYQLAKIDPDLLWRLLEKIGRAHV